MGITDTNGHFNTKVARKMLDEYDNDYQQHDRQLAAIATQTCAIIKDAERLYEENDVLYETVGKLSSTLSERIMELEAENTELRELVRTIYMCSSIRCNHCEYGYGDTCSFDAESELRKLGVEVDE